MKKALILIFISFPFIWTPLMAQKVVTINQRPQGNEIIISFEIKGVKKNQEVWIKPILISPNLPNDQEVIKSIRGDLGPFDADGPQRIIWELYKDIPALPPNSTIGIEITKKWKVQSHHCLSVSGNSLAPYGLKYHHLGQHGFYLSLKTLNLDFNKAIGSSSELLNGSLTPENPFQFLGAVRQSYSFNAGYSFSLTPYLWAYGGAGLGADRSLWEVTNLDEYLIPAGNTYWVEYSDTPKYGNLFWMAECGLNFKLNRFILDGGIGFTGLRQVYFNFGLGYIISSSKGYKPSPSLQ